MKKLVEYWSDGVSWLFSDDLISFYTYFTIIFAECAFLWSHYQFSTAFPFTIILLVWVLNIIICAWIKGHCDICLKGQKITSIAYVSIFVISFIIGCIFNPLMSILLAIIPAVITFLWIQIRSIQDTVGFEGFIPKLFDNKRFYIFSQIVVVGGPFIVFVIFLAMIPALPIVLKILIPILYLLCIPLICNYEDDSATCNIFELAYQIG